MLYTAILVACLTSMPSDCRSHEILIDSSPIPTTAFMEAQIKAVEWLNQHPGLSQHSLTIHPGRES